MRLEINLQIPGDEDSEMSASIPTIHSPMPGAQRTFRAKGPVRFAGAVGLVGAIWLIDLGATAHGPHAAAGRVFSYISAGLMIAFSIRAFNLGVLATKDQVRIRNLLITRWVRWSDIEEFSFGQLRIFPAVGIVTLRDGRKMAITGISYGRAARKGVRANAASQIAELNQLLWDRRADAHAGRQPS